MTKAIRTESMGGALFDSWCQDHPKHAATPRDGARFVLEHGMMLGLDNRIIAYASHVLVTPATEGDPR